MGLTLAPNAQRMNLPSMNVADTNAFLADVHFSRDSDKPITCGFFRIEKGKPLIYDYHYDEMKLLVEGEMTITDEVGQSVHVKPGDVLYFAKGSRITFDSPTFGVGFFCGQRNWGEA